jgi:hypothetical protein
LQENFAVINEDAVGLVSKAFEGNGGAGNAYALIFLRQDNREKSGSAGKGGESMSITIKRIANAYHCLLRISF